MCPRPFLRAVDIGMVNGGQLSFVYVNSVTSTGEEGWVGKDSV